MLSILINWWYSYPCNPYTKPHNHKVASIIIIYKSCTLATDADNYQRAATTSQSLPNVVNAIIKNTTKVQDQFVYAARIGAMTMIANYGNVKHY